MKQNIFLSDGVKKMKIQLDVGDYAVNEINVTAEDQQLKVHCCKEVEDRGKLLDMGDLTDLQKTRPDTRLPKSRAGGQGPYLRAPDHLGRSSEVKEIKS